MRCCKKSPIQRNRPGGWLSEVEAERPFRYQRYVCSGPASPSDSWDRGPHLTLSMRLVPLCLLVALVAACSPPRGTILQSEIVKESKQEDATFEIIGVDRNTLARVATWPATGHGLDLSWPGKGAGQGARALRAGDKINLTIWDSQENSLLASPDQRSVPMQGLVISPAGSIFVPYIDEIRISGLSPERARADIQARLTAIVPSAQVQLEVEQGDLNTIEMVSGVAQPGRLPVAARGATILSVLAEAGGIPDTMRNPVVRLQRNGRAYAALAADLYRDPARDILMRGGDRVVVESDPRSFVVMGAASAEKTVHFEKASHSLLEALSLSSGLTEARANIRGVLILRQYPLKVLRQDGAGPARERIVFTFDLGTGDGLFAARSFQVHPDDIVLVTESPLPMAANILGVFGSTLGIAQRISGVN